MWLHDPGHISPPHPTENLYRLGKGLKSEWKDPEKAERHSTHAHTLTCSQAERNAKRESALGVARASMHAVLTSKIFHHLALCTLDMESFPLPYWGCTCTHGGS